VKPCEVGYLIGTGHFFAGAVVFVTAEVLKLTLVERLFQLNKKKLLSISVFAWGYGYWRRMMDFLESTTAWRMSRRLVADWARALKIRIERRRASPKKRSPDRPRLGENTSLPKH
jgi:hypothetical protein